MFHAEFVLNGKGTKEIIEMANYRNDDCDNVQTLVVNPMNWNCGFITVVTYHFLPLCHFLPGQKMEYAMFYPVKEWNSILCHFCTKITINVKEWNGSLQTLRCR